MSTSMEISEFDEMQTDGSNICVCKNFGTRNRFARTSNFIPTEYCVM